LIATDKDGTKLAYKIVKPPAKGKLSGIAPNLTYTPALGFSGLDQFDFAVNDGKANSNVANVQITITDPNDAPVFTVNPISLPAGSSGIAYIGQSIASYATDPDKVETLVFSKVSGPDWLEVSANGSLAGTPPSEAEGLNEFTVRVTDKEAVSAAAVLNIQINSPALPLPWEMAQIGSTGLEDLAACQAETFTLQGSGRLATAKDEGCFVWQTLSGDGEIIARVSALEGADPLAAAGVMIRDSLAANSPHMFLGVNGKGVIRRASRAKAGAPAAMRSHGAGRPPTVWLRLIRKGKIVSAYKSTNGVRWTLIDSQKTAFPANCYIGLSVSGGQESQSASSFRDVIVVP